MTNRLLIKVAAPVLILLGLVLRPAARPALADSQQFTVSDVTYVLGSCGAACTEEINGSFTLTESGFTTSISSVDFASTGPLSSSAWSSTPCPPHLPIAGALPLCFEAEGSSDIVQLTFPLPLADGSSGKLVKALSLFFVPSKLPITGHPEISSGKYSISAVSKTVPEPSSVLLLAAGLSGMLGLLARKRPA